MGKDAQIQCKCGKVEGVMHDLSRSSTNHVLCGCKGCQAYAHYLGRAEEMLDSEGRSNIFQMNPAKIEISKGMDQVAAVRITPKGPLRWHASCCNTPIANTMPKGGLPFAGVLPISIGHKGTSDAVSNLVGPVRAEVNTATPPSFTEKLKLFGMLLGLTSKMLWWRISGGKSWRPFFDKETLDPVKEPITISDAEREGLYAKVIGRT